MMVQLLRDFELDYRGEENVPSVLCESWQRFSALVESFNRLPDAQFIFRGQRRADWELTPGLARFNDLIHKTQNHGIVLEAHANEQIALFRKAIRGRVNSGLLASTTASTHRCSIGPTHRMSPSSSPSKKRTALAKPIIPIESSMS
jgi:hypothetical protein